MRAVWRYPVLALAALGVLGVPNLARAQNAAAHSDEDNNFFELNIYGGYSDYAETARGWAARFRAPPSWAAGSRRISGITSLSKKTSTRIRGTNMISSRIRRRLMLQPPFPIHTLQPAVDIVLHFTPRDHRFRPFVLAGPGASFDVLGKNAKKLGQAMPSSAGFSGFQDR